MPSLLDSLKNTLLKKDMISEDNYLGIALLAHLDANRDTMSEKERDIVVEQVCILENLYIIADTFCDSMDHPLSHLSDGHDIIEAAELIECGVKLMIKTGAFEQTLLRIYRLHGVEVKIDLDASRQALGEIGARLVALRAKDAEVETMLGGLH